MYTVARLCVHLFPLGTIDSLICIHPTSRPAIGSERLDITLSSTGLASVRRRFFEFVISLACLLVSRIRPCLEMRSVSPFVRKLSAYYISSSSFIGLSLTRDQSSCWFLIKYHSYVSNLSHIPSEAVPRAVSSFLAIAL